MQTRGVKLSEIEHTELLEIHKELEDVLKYLENQYDNIKKMEADNS